MIPDQTHAQQADTAQSNTVRSNAAAPAITCIIYELNEGAGPEYERLHSAVWPEVRTVLAASGVHDYSIYRRADLVISTYRTHDVSYTPSESEQAALDRWRDTLAPLFKRIVDEHGNPLVASEIFRLD